MEQKEEMIAMLHQIPSPAFFVENGRVTSVNHPAQQCGLSEDLAIDSLLATGREEYQNFRDGWLYLTIHVCDIPSSVCVCRVGQAHLFVLEQDADQAELQSMALAAQALRTPLSNVMTVADRLFPLRGSDDSPQAQEQAARINRGLYQMLRIICNMSDAYRYSTDAALRTEIRDVGGLLLEIFQRTAPLMEHTGIHLDYEVPREVIYSLVDASRLERAVSNILSNAIKFTPKGGSIFARLRRKGKMLYLTVQDSGSGICDDARDNLFSRYQRLPGIEDSRFGLGLGIVLIRSTAAAHGGTVLVEQGQDFGLRLTMTLPIRQADDPMVRSPMIHVDYAGERDHLLLEYADVLPWDLYLPDQIN